MSVLRPPLNSVWENDEGDRLVVIGLSRLFTEKETTAAGIIAWREQAPKADRRRELFVVRYAEYADGHDIGCEIDNEQWADLIASAGFRMTGIEPRG